VRVVLDIDIVRRRSDNQVNTSGQDFSGGENIPVDDRNPVVFEKIIVAQQLTPLDLRPARSKDIRTGYSFTGLMAFQVTGRVLFLIGKNPEGSLKVLKHSFPE